MNSTILDRDGFVDAKPGEGTLLMHSGSLVRLLCQKNVKNLDYSEFTNPRPIGKGATATVYLTTSRRKNYALKSGFDSDQNMNNHGDSPTSSNL
ncbi:1682_t:CDS:2 [Gigaspora rosea]|nr:1682_t:CDS:2 [Gigaspora rosea]